MSQTIEQQVSGLPEDLVRMQEEYDKRKERLTGKNRYTVFNKGHLYMLQSRERAVLGALARHGFTTLTTSRIFELGSGRGAVLQDFLRWGAKPHLLHGVDLLFDYLQLARVKLPHLPLLCANGENIPYADESFDLVAQFTAFSSVLSDPIKRHLASEMVRILRPDGLIVWYDFWINPVNKQTKGIRPKEIRALFPGCKLDFHRTYLAPPIARRIAPISWSLAVLLESLSIFNTHYIVVIEKLDKKA